VGEKKNVKGRRVELNDKVSSRTAGKIGDRRGGGQLTREILEFQGKETRFPTTKDTQKIKTKTEGLVYGDEKRKKGSDRIPGRGNVV